MRRFVTLVFLLFFTVPFGISIAGCSKSTPVVYCNGGDSGPVVGQLFAINVAAKALRNLAELRPDRSSEFAFGDGLQRYCGFYKYLYVWHDRHDAG